MLNILFFVLQLVVLGVVLFLVFNLLKKFVFAKVKINKWIPFAIAIILFIVQFFLRIQNQYQNLALTIVVLIFFMWFLDIHQGGGPSSKKKEKQIEIRPKAKPNRVKHLNKDKK